MLGFPSQFLAPPPRRAAAAASRALEAAFSVSPSHSAAVSRTNHENSKSNESSNAQKRNRAGNSKLNGDSKSGRLSPDEPHSGPEETPKRPRKRANESKTANIQEHNGIEADEPPRRGRSSHRPSVVSDSDVDSEVSDSSVSYWSPLINCQTIGIAAATSLPAPDSQRALLRSLWQFGAIMDFCRVFRSPLSIHSFSCAELEHGLISPYLNPLMNELLWALLYDRRIDTLSLKKLKEDGEDWADRLSAAVAPVAERMFTVNPFAVEYSWEALEPVERCLILHWLCERKLEGEEDCMEMRREDEDSDAMRREPIGRDAEGNIYYHLSNDPWIFREINQLADQQDGAGDDEAEAKSNSGRKGFQRKIFADETSMKAELMNESTPADGQAAAASAVPPPPLPHRSSSVDSGLTRLPRPYSLRWDFFAVSSSKCWDVVSTSIEDLRRLIDSLKAFEVGRVAKAHRAEQSKLIAILEEEIYAKLIAGEEKRRKDEERRMRSLLVPRRISSRVVSLESKKKEEEERAIAIEIRREEERIRKEQTKRRKEREKRRKARDQEREELKSLQETVTALESSGEQGQAEERQRERLLVLQRLRAEVWLRKVLFDEKEAIRSKVREERERRRKKAEDTRRRRKLAKEENQAAQASSQVLEKGDGMPGDTVQSAASEIEMSDEVQPKPLASVAAPGPASVSVSVESDDGSEPSGGESSDFSTDDELPEADPALMITERDDPYDRLDKLIRLQGLEEGEDREFLRSLSADQLLIIRGGLHDSELLAKYGITKRRRSTEIDPEDRNGYRVIIRIKKSGIKTPPPKSAEELEAERKALLEALKPVKVRPTRSQSSGSSDADREFSRQLKRERDRLRRIRIRKSQIEQEITKIKSDHEKIVETIKQYQSIQQQQPQQQTLPALDDLRRDELSLQVKYSKLIEDLRLTKKKEDESSVKVEANKVERRRRKDARKGQTNQSQEHSRSRTQSDSDSDSESSSQSSSSSSGSDSGSDSDSDSSSSSSSSSSSGSAQRRRSAKKKASPTSASPRVPAFPHSQAAQAQPQSHAAHSSAFNPNMNSFISLLLQQQQQQQRMALMAAAAQPRTDNSSTSNTAPVPHGSAEVSSSASSSALPTNPMFFPGFGLQFPPVSASAAPPSPAELYQQLIQRAMLMQNQSNQAQMAMLQAQQAKAPSPVQPPAPPH